MKTLKILTITFILFFTPNIFASYVATITAIKGEAFIERDSEKIVATLGLQLEEKDTISTKENTKVQLIFKDETIISLGHNTNFSIQEYLFEDASEPIAKFGMFKGAIRTITGKIGKIAPDKFSVNTKTATIGIRGTNFTTVVRNDSFNVFCTYGAIKVTVSGQTFNIPQGYFLNVNMDGLISKKEFSSKDLKKMRDETFGTPLKKSKVIAQETLESIEKNEEHLDTTIKDEMNIVIQDATDTSSETILNPGADIITDSAVVAEYSMNHANYLGSYTTTLNTTSLASVGGAKLSVNFAENSALLELGSFENPSPTLSYNIENISSNTFNGTLNQGEGEADGSFFGPTGNIVKGNFSYSENEGEAEGNYNVVSTQTLY